MFRLLKIAIIRMYVKERKKTIFTTKIIYYNELRLNTAFFPSVLYRLLYLKHAFVFQI